MLPRDGSGVRGTVETKEMLEFCAGHGIVSDYELITPDQIGVAFERLERGDVRHRFVLDMRQAQASFRNAPTVKRTKSLETSAPNADLGQRKEVGVATRRFEPCSRRGPLARVASGRTARRMRPHSEAVLSTMTSWRIGTSTVRHDQSELIQASMTAAPASSTTLRASGGMRRSGSFDLMRARSTLFAGSLGATSWPPGIPRRIVIG